MGLYVHNIGNLPVDDKRNYFLYVLDYGWHEPLAQALRENFTNMARMASKTKSVVIAGVEPVHFENQVFSAHGINGEPGEEILPAILITTLHPRYFQENQGRWRDDGTIDDKLLLIPLKKCCATTTDVVNLIHRVFRDIEGKSALQDFEVVNSFRKAERRSLTDAIVLQPNFGGVGIDLRKLFE